MRSTRVSLIAVFAGVSVVLDSLITPGFSSGVWFGWIFIVSPVTGMILGPLDGFLSTLLSVLVGHTLVFRGSVYEYIFGLGAPLCSSISGLVLRDGWSVAVSYFSLLLGLYFVTPVSAGLPLWGIWDILLAYAVLIFWGLQRKTGVPGFVDGFRCRVAMAAFIGLEADVLFRIFVLVPCRAYEYFYGMTPETLILIWSLPAPIVTPVKVLASVLLSALLVPSIRESMRGHPYFQG